MNFACTSSKTKKSYTYTEKLMEVIPSSVFLYPMDKRVKDSTFC